MTQGRALFGIALPSVNPSAETGTWVGVRGRLRSPRRDAPEGLRFEPVVELDAAQRLGHAKDYARLWTAGYSWRDVANRPPAPDAVEVKLGKGVPRLPAGPVSITEFGPHAAGIEQARSDRAAVIGMLERMSKAERALLPEIVPTVDQLLERATDLARTLAALERDFDESSVDKIDTRLRALAQELPSTDRERRQQLLQQQRQKVEQLWEARVHISSPRVPAL